MAAASVRAAACAREASRSGTGGGKLPTDFSVLMKLKT